jgi:hypothetical protein
MKWKQLSLNSKLNLLISPSMLLIIKEVENFKLRFLLISHKVSKIKLLRIILPVREQ